MRRLVVLVAAFLAVGFMATTPSIAAPKTGPRLSSVEIERRTDALAAQLRCPVCQQLSVRDSPSRVSRMFRGRIRDLVAQGRSDDQVRAFFVARYGEWILLSPPRRGIGWAVWLLPPALLAVGGLLLVVAVRRWTARAARLAQAGAARPEVVAAVRARVAELERQKAVGGGT